MVEFIPLEIQNNEAINCMSKLATEIVREHFDPLIGTAQNNYMLEMFQSPKAISEQLEAGYSYFFIKMQEETIGFLAYYPDGQAMHISKFYLKKEHRGHGYAWHMLDFIIEKAKVSGKMSLELNVNKDNDAVFAYEKMGFECIRSEVNDIGQGFVMDDYVYQLKI